MDEFPLSNSFTEERNDTKALSHEMSSALSTEELHEVFGHLAETDPLKDNTIKIFLSDENIFREIVAGVTMEPLPNNALRACSESSQWNKNIV